MLLKYVLVDPKLAFKTHSYCQFVNGKLVTRHAGGHIPFLAEVTSFLKYGQKNLISVAVNNTLTDITVPQGSVGTIQT
jgi:beta-glucuronidase